MKKVMILLVGLAFLTGCTTIQNLWDKAVDSAEPPEETTVIVTDEIV